LKKQIKYLFFLRNLPAGIQNLPISMALGGAGVYNCREW